MAKTIYYWESERRSGRLEACSDAEAIQQIRPSFLIVYKEADTPDGTPFIIIWEKEKSISS